MALVYMRCAGMQPHVNLEGIRITEDFITGSTFICQRLAVMFPAVTHELLVTMAPPVTEGAQDRVGTQRIKDPLFILLPVMSTQIPTQWFQEFDLLIMHGLHHGY